MCVALLGEVWCQMKSFILVVLHNFQIYIIN